MRILLLCDRVPDSPSDGLLLRVLALVSELAQRHDIDLLCWHQPGGPVEVADGLFGRVWMAPAPPPRRVANWMASLRGWGPDALYLHSPETVQLLAEKIDPMQYDVIWDAGAVLFSYLPPRWDGVPVVADLVDDMVLTYRRAMRAETRLLGKLRMWKYAHIFGRFEAETMRRVTQCVVVGEDDAASFARVSPHVPVAVVANGVDTEYFAPDGTPVVPGRLVFEGTMSFPPNVHAAVHLVREIMPLIWSVRPDVTLCLVGRAPPEAVLALASERVVVTGSVADVRDHVLQAQVFVCPLVAGAGIKNKLLQAWAMARPVVATPISIGGLAARDGVDLLVRDGPSDFAAGVLELLDDGQRATALAAAGREVAVRRFAWAAMADAFEVLLMEAANGR